MNYWLELQKINSTLRHNNRMQSEFRKLRLPRPLMRDFMKKRINLMVTKFAIGVVLSLVVTFGSHAQDNERIAQLEKEMQETKERLSILESILRNEIDEKGLDVTNEGWKSLDNWRELTTGMRTEAVQKILGNAHRIEGGTITAWHYENEGIVVFYEGKVERWSEPD